MKRLAAASISVFALACSSSDPPDPAGDAGSSPACPTPTMGPTAQSGRTISADETWTADSSPHVLEGDLSVGAGATLTIEPCAEIRISAGNFFRVDGTLRARGEATKPITIRADDPARPFASLVIRHPGNAELIYVTIEGGGEVPSTSYGETVSVEGGSELPVVRPLHVENVTIRSSAGHGINLRQWTGFTEGSRDLTITGSGASVADRPFPMRINLNAVKTIPSGNYTGNAADEIQVISDSPHYKVSGEERFKDRGVAYRIGGNGAFGTIEVSDLTAPSTLVIEPGVVMRFSSTESSVGGLHIGGSRNEMPASGTLIAQGTAEAPIVLSAEPSKQAAGAWEGVVFESVSPNTVMQNVRIEYAGAHGGDRGYGCPPNGSLDSDGALKIFQAPDSEFFTSSVIADSSTHGVFRGWEGSEVDFLPTNVFEGVSGCHQVLPKPPGGACPASPSCPR